MPGEQDDKQTNVIVHAPRHKEAKPFRWPPSTMVGDAAKQAATAFGYAPNGSPTFMTRDGDVLDRNRSLADQGVQSGDKLELVDGGGGVSLAPFGAPE